MSDKRRSTSKDLADWTRLLAKHKSTGTGTSTAPGQTVKTVRVRLGAWNVNLIGVAGEDESPSIEVDCPADLLVLHAELVTLFGVVQEKFGVLIEQAAAKEKLERRE